MADISKIQVGEQEYTVGFTDEDVIKIENELAEATTKVDNLEEKVDNLELTAEKVSYDDSSTSLGASNVQSAISQLNTHLTDKDSLRLNGLTTNIKFGVDSNGNYGYIKDGADTVIPFKKGECELIFSKYTQSSNGSWSYTTEKYYPLIVVVSSSTDTNSSNTKNSAITGLSYCSDLISNYDSNRMLYTHYAYGKNVAKGTTIAQNSLSYQQHTMIFGIS